MHCINLKQKFGHRYRVIREESYQAEHGPGARTEDPCLMIIPCKWGEILPWGEAILAAAVDGHPILAGRLRALECCRVHQGGDLGELTVLLDVADFAKVARIMRPRRRRRLSESARRRLVEAGAKTRFQPGTRGHSTARGAISEAQGDQKAVQRQLPLFGV